jgi:hypothetical protein
VRGDRLDVILAPGPRWVFSGFIVVLIGVGISDRRLRPQRMAVALGVGNSKRACLKTGRVARFEFYGHLVHSARLDGAHSIPHNQVIDYITISIYTLCPG